MINDTVAKHTLAPVILRLALGVIFTYHGLMKVGDADNLWGAAWASNYWRSQDRPAPELLAKIDQMRDVNDDDKRILKNRLKEAYARQDPQLPQMLQYPGAQLAVAWGELAGGIALLLGLFTRLSALGMIVIQAGAVAMVTFDQGFSLSSGAGGYEYNVALLAMCLALVITGAGTLAIDPYLAAYWRRRTTTPPSQVPAAV